MFLFMKSYDDLLEDFPVHVGDPKKQMKILKAAAKKARTDEERWFVHMKMIELENDPHHTI